MPTRPKSLSKFNPVQWWVQGPDWSPSVGQYQSGKVTLYYQELGFGCAGLGGLLSPHVHKETMMKEGDPETEIDLGDSEQESSDEQEEPQRLWKAPSREEEEDMTSALVDISDTKPLLNIRDPRGINDCLKVTFEDVIAEPLSVRSGDRVWIWSNALFEVMRVWIYRIVTVLLAIPVSILSGLLFAILSCLHIWMVSPFIRSILIGTSCLQTLWSTVLDVVVRPFLFSAARCCGGISVHLARE